LAMSGSGINTHCYALEYSLIIVSVPRQYHTRQNQSTHSCCHTPHQCTPASRCSLLWNPYFHAWMFIASSRTFKAIPWVLCSCLSVRNVLKTINQLYTTLKNTDTRNTYKQNVHGLRCVLISPAKTLL
jgi:hypothetical protein